MAAVRKPFEKPRKHADEITVRCENCEENMYASKTFLEHISHVFLAMFQSDFKEANTSELEIKDISRGYFLEFFLCCNSGTMKNIIRLIINTSTTSAITTIITDVTSAITTNAITTINTSATSDITTINASTNTCRS
ncbi:hypothetical protein DPMN_040919 [Dreissena polymorpha]|uniref:BTB domain-containing protein n=1 Tax=Dreissena polymorpha TaxID=45954 RepID=A0A9D4CY27_DREPO|nr:hypothetical protein DPMN_040919 [Dreissena polymorpha]